MGALGLLPVVGGRKCFAMVLTHVTSPNTQPEASNLFSSDCHEMNVSGSPPVQMKGDTMFLLHATYFAGPPFLQLPGAIIAARLSPTRVIGCSVLITSVISLMLPLVLQTNTTVLFLLRFLQGAVEGLQQPASIGLLSVWCTDKDRTRLFGIYFTGAYFAPVLASVVTGFTLCFVTWTCSLYIYGGFGVVWSVVWMCMIYDRPDLHPNLTTEERLLHQQHGTQLSAGRKTLGSIPWKSLFTSGPVWAVFVGNFCRTFIYSMLVVEQPQYYKDAFNLNAADAIVIIITVVTPYRCHPYKSSPRTIVMPTIVTPTDCCLPSTIVTPYRHHVSPGVVQIGLVSTLPHVGLSASCAVGGVVSDRLLAWGVSTTTTRKLLYSTEFAGVVAGLCTIGTIGAIVNSVLASAMTGKSRSLSDWQTLYLISGLVHLSGVLIFNLVAKAERQPWADYKYLHTPETLQGEEEEKVCMSVGMSENEDEMLASSRVETTPLKTRR
ncbi:hypothetical protein BaRGS_00005645 [Batillaria attramentaria]|uniref:Major facilitator superfamily (MFS) profile domain-containing protein n=1 Tax=Batillaria attramentaria TaxID=370345 RepID=A0ABD0LVG4_9CAEN